MANKTQIGNQALNTTSSPSFTAVTPGNININGNTLSATNTDGDVYVNANGFGYVITGSGVTSNPLSAGTSSGGLMNYGIPGSRTAGIYLGTYLNAATGPQIVSYKTRATTLGSNAAVQSGDSVLAVQGWADDGSAIKACSAILSNVSGTVSSGIVPTQMTFRTCNTSGTLTTALTISNAQVVTLANPLPVASGGTGIAAFGTGVATALGQNVTGSGGIVLASGPTIATSIINACTLNQTSSATTFQNNTALSNQLAPNSTGTTEISGFDWVAGGNVYARIAATRAGAGSSIRIGTSNSYGSGITNTAVTIDQNGSVQIANALTLGTALTAANGGTGITALGTGVATALGISTTATGGFATQINNTSYTPVVSFATPGDISVSYSTQVGSYSRNGNIVVYNFGLVFTPTYTTSSGVLTISLPITAGSAAQGWVGSLGNSGGANATYPAGRTMVVGNIDASNSVLYLRASGTGVASSNMTTANFTSGLQYTISGSITYAVA